MGGKGDHFIRFLSDWNYPQVWGTRPGVVSHVLQFLPAACQLAPAAPGTRADQWQRLGQAVAAADAGHGRWTDGSRLDAARGAPVPRAAVAAASGGMSRQGGGKRHGKVA